VARIQHFLSFSANKKGEQQIIMAITSLLFSGDNFTSLSKVRRILEVGFSIWWL